jgi:glycosyltransferase involved in cell wall biosynthesis
MSMSGSSTASRPHVLMFLTRPMDFSDAWARAARQVAKITTIERVDELSGKPLDPGGYLALRPGSEDTFELKAAPFLYANPSVLFRPIFHLLQNRAILGALDAVAARRGRIDVLHTHFFSLWGLAEVSRAAGIPLVHTEHSSSLAPDEDQPVSSKRVSPLGLRMARKLFRGAHRVLPVSRYLATCIERRGLGGRLRPTPNPIDIARFRPVPLPAWDREIRLVSIGRLAPEKNQLLLLRALARARVREPRLKLQLLGKGPLEGELRRHVAELGLNGAVELRGFVPNQQIPQVLADAHAFATTTRMETFGVAVAEALASARPVVASRVAALPELVSDDSLGALAPPNDEAAFAEALLSVAARLGRFSPERFVSHAQSTFSDDAVARSLAEIYEDCQRPSNQAGRGGSRRNALGPEHPSQ